MKFPPSLLDDLIDFLVHEKVTDHTKSWHLHSRTMLQNFRKISSGDFEILPFLSLNDPTDKNAFGQFGWFSRIGSHFYTYIKMHPHYAAWQNTTHRSFVVWQKLLGICCQFYRVQIKKEFFEKVTKTVERDQ